MKTHTHKSLVLCTITLLCCCLAVAQKSLAVKGKLPITKETEVRLMGYNNLKDTILSKSTTDNLGNFTLAYPEKYKGAAQLQIKDGPAMIILLNNENPKIEWSDFNDFNNLSISGSKENEYFKAAFEINQQAQKKLAGLRYLKPLYEKPGNPADFYALLQREIDTENNRFLAYVNTLPADSYAKQYLRHRKLSDLLEAAAEQKEMGPEAEKEFEGLDFCNASLQRSGLMETILSGYLGLLVNKSEDLATKEATLAAWTKGLLESIIKQPGREKLANAIAVYLFKYYERYAMVKVSGQLAVYALEDKRFGLDTTERALFEQYRKMAVGQTAPELMLPNCNNAYESIKDMKNSYTVVAFGASGCDLCTRELPEFDNYAVHFRDNYAAGIVFVSLDTDEKAYHDFIKDMKITTTCDFKGWGGNNAKNYFIAATPTIYILDHNNKIVAKPASAIETAKWLGENSKKL